MLEPVFRGYGGMTVIHFSPSASVSLFRLNCRWFKLILQSRGRPPESVKYSTTAVRRAGCPESGLPQEQREFGNAVRAEISVTHSLAI